MLWAMDLTFAQHRDLLMHFFAVWKIGKIAIDTKNRRETLNKKGRRLRGNKGAGFLSLRILKVSVLRDIVESHTSHEEVIHIPADKCNLKSLENMTCSYSFKVNLINRKNRLNTLCCIWMCLHSCDSHLVKEILSNSNSTAKPLLPTANKVGLQSLMDVFHSCNL